MAMAGIWEHWMHPCGSEILSVSLITTAANATVRKIHHRMPVILEPENWSRWLDTENVKAEGLSELLISGSDDLLKAHPVSLRVNKTEVDEASLIEEVHEVAKDNPRSDQLDLFQD